MTDKQLKKLSRLELLELLVQMSESNDRLQEETKNMRKELDERATIAEIATSLGAVANTLNGSIGSVEKNGGYYIQQLMHALSEANAVRRELEKEREELKLQREELQTERREVKLVLDRLRNGLQKAVEDVEDEYDEEDFIEDEAEAIAESSEIKDIEEKNEKVHEIAAEAVERGEKPEPEPAKKVVPEAAPAVLEQPSSTLTIEMFDGVDYVSMI